MQHSRDGNSSTERVRGCTLQVDENYSAGAALVRSGCALGGHVHTCNGLNRKHAGAV